MANTENRATVLVKRPSGQVDIITRERFDREENDFKRLSKSPMFTGQEPGELIDETDEQYEARTRAKSPVGQPNTTIANLATFDAATIAKPEPIRKLAPVGAAPAGQRVAVDEHAPQSDAERAAANATRTASANAEQAKRNADALAQQAEQAKSVAEAAEKTAEETEKRGADVGRDTSETRSRAEATTTDQGHGTGAKSRKSAEPKAAAKRKR